MVFSALSVYEYEMRKRCFWDVSTWSFEVVLVPILNPYPGRFTVSAGATHPLDFSVSCSPVVQHGNFHAAERRREVA